MRSFRDRNPYAIGIVSVGTIALLVAAAFAVGILHLFERTYTVTGVFGDAAGVRGGDDVRVAGVKAGRVTKVVADGRRGNVRIEMVVNRGVHLGPDTTAEVALQTLLGTKYVRLGGAVHRPYLTGGAVIPLGRTKTPFDVFDLTNVSKHTIDDTDTKALNRLVDQLATVTEGRRDDTARLLGGLGKVSTAVSERNTQLAELLERAQTLSGTLAAKDQTLAGLLDQSAKVLAVVRANRADLATALRGSDKVTAQLASLLRQHKAELDGILATLHPTVAILDRRQQDLDRALAYLGPGVLGLSEATTHGLWSDIYVRAVGPDFVQALEDVRRRLTGS